MLPLGGIAERLVALSDEDPIRPFGAIWDMGRERQAQCLRSLRLRREVEVGDMLQQVGVRKHVAILAIAVKFLRLFFSIRLVDLRFMLV